MAARPPTGDDDTQEPSVFGIAAVDEHLSGANFSYPVTPDEILDAVGDPEVQCGPNAHDVSLSTALERTNRQRFDSRTDLLDELHDAFEYERRGSNGLVNWLRSLVGG